MKLFFRYRLRRLTALLLTMIFLIFTACACSDSRAGELEDFRGEITSFFERCEAYNKTIASLDPANPNARDVLLTTADKMLDDAKAVREVKAPSVFVNFPHYAEEYCAHTENAVASLHRAFADGTFDQASFNTALPELEAAASSLSFMIEELRSAARTNQP